MISEQRECATPARGRQPRTRTDQEGMGMAAKKKSAKPYGNKTNFVMSLPREMPAKQVVDRAKQQGMVISEAHVYKIRSTNKEKAPGKPSSPRSSGKATKAPTPRAPERSSGASEKRDFVLSFSPSTPASEILRKAKESGLGLSKAYLYTIRASAGTKPTGRAAKAQPMPRAPQGRARANGGGSLESQFVEAAIDLGLARAAELLDRVRSRLKSAY
jgi:hypothetical protein